MNSFLDAFGGIPAPLYLLVLVPYAWYFYMRRYRPEVKLTPFGGRAVEHTSIFFATVLVALSLFLLSAFRLGMAHFAP